MNFHVASMTAGLCLALGACSAFQGNEAVQAVPVTPVEQTKLAPLPPIAPASQARLSPPVAQPAGGAVQAPPRPTPPPLPSQTVAPPPAAGASGVSNPPPPQPPPVQQASQAPNGLIPLPPARAPGSLAGPAPAQPSSSLTAPFTPQTPRALSGDWNVHEPARPQGCRLNLASTGIAGVLDAVTQGCASVELTRTAGWQSRGQDLVLLDARAAPIVLFRPAGPNRFEGLGLAGETFVLTR